MKNLFLISLATILISLSPQAFAQANDLSDLPLDNWSTQLTEAIQKLSSASVPSVTGPQGASYDYWSSISEAEIARIKEFDAWLIKHITIAIEDFSKLKKQMNSSLAVLDSLAREEKNYDASDAYRLWKRTLKKKRKAFRLQVMQSIYDISYQLYLSSCALGKAYSYDGYEISKENPDCKGDYNLHSYFQTDIGIKDGKPIKMTLGAIYFDIMANHANAVAKALKFIDHQVIELPEMRKIKVWKIPGAKHIHAHSLTWMGGHVVLLVPYYNYEIKIQTKDYWLNHAYLEYLKEGYHQP